MAVVRKRDRYTRERAKRGRPKTPAPSAGWLIADLARLSQVSVRTLRSYVTRGLLRHSEFRGTLTRYPRSELLRLLGLLRLRAESKADLAEIKRKLDALGESELEAWLLSGPLSSAQATALGVVPTADSRAESAGAVQALPRARGNGAVETWYRVQALPGLELMLSDSASPLVRGIAQKILDEIVGHDPFAGSLPIPPGKR